MLPHAKRGPSPSQTKVPTTYTISAGREPVARAAQSQTLSKGLIFLSFFPLASLVTPASLVVEAWKSLSSCSWEGESDRSIRKQLAERDLISAMETRKEWHAFACWRIRRVSET